MHVNDVNIANQFRELPKPRSVKVLQASFFKSICDPQEARNRPLSFDFDDTRFVQLFAAYKQAAVMSLGEKRLMQGQNASFCSTALVGNMNQCDAERHSFS